MIVAKVADVMLRDPVPWFWNVTPLGVIRPGGIYREVSVSVFHSSCVKCSYPDFLSVGQGSWHEKESSRNGWHVCWLSRSCLSSSHHMTSVPLRNASHLLKHAPHTVTKIFERQQFPRVIFWKWLFKCRHTNCIFMFLHLWLHEKIGFWHLSHRNWSLNSTIWIWIIQTA